MPYEIEAPIKRRDLTASGRSRMYAFMFAELIERLSGMDGDAAIPVCFDSTARAVNARISLVQYHQEQFPNLRATQRKERLFFWLEDGSGGHD